LGDSQDFKGLYEVYGPEKVNVRLQILVSPTCKTLQTQKRDRIFAMDKGMFVIIDDNGHESCGFIPEAV
jgi:hypothetical protein